MARRNYDAPTVAAQLCAVAPDVPDDILQIDPAACVVGGVLRLRLRGHNIQCTAREAWLVGEAFAAGRASEAHLTYGAQQAG
jgi:hypothetical protein